MTGSRTSFLLRARMRLAYASSPEARNTACLPMPCSPHDMATHVSLSFCGSATNIPDYQYHLGLSMKEYQYNIPDVRAHPRRLE